MFSKNQTLNSEPCAMNFSAREDSLHDHATLRTPHLSHPHGPAGAAGFRVAVKETDLWVLAARDFSPRSGKSSSRNGSRLEAYIARHPDFLTTLVPWPADPLAPAVVREMIEAAAAAGVGPMAAVAGALAARVGRQLAPLSPEVIVENGGDIFLAIQQPATVALFAGQSPLSHRVGLQPRPQPQSFGGVHLFGQRGAFLEPRPSRRRLCPGRKRRPGRCRGHGLGNRVQGPDTIASALAWAAALPDILGAVVIVGEKLGAWAGWNWCP